MSITHISDTAAWVAMYRALESERPDAIFHDPYARRLAGERGETILDAIPKARSWGWPMVVRTALMDEMTEHLVWEERADLVINLAAGLDARPYRLRLPAELHWVEVDFPDVITYKEGILQGESPRCRLERVPLDLADREARQGLFDRLGADARRALVIAEGLLVYLGAEGVEALAADLRAVPTIEWWLIDLASPKVLAWMEKSWGQQVAAGGAPFRFAPAEGTAFFSRLGWREEAYRSTGEEAERLGRAPWWWPIPRFLGRFASSRRREEARRMSGVALLSVDGER